MRSTDDLAAKLNYLNKPGYHSILSPVVGSRSDELKEVQTHPKLIAFEKQIYQSENIYFIAKDQREKANAIAREIFLEYINKYEKFGVTEHNIVKFSKTDLPGAGSNKTWLSSLENEWNTWRVYTVIEADNGIYNEKFGCYLPPYIVAYHEIMHVEETPKGISESAYNRTPGKEILTALKTIILLDEVYKKVNDVPLSQVVDYKRNIIIGEKTVQLGYIANFYRRLEEKHKSLSKALVSEDSLQFLSAIKIENEYDKRIPIRPLIDNTWMMAGSSENLSWMKSLERYDNLDQTLDDGFASDSGRHLESSTGKYLLEYLLKNNKEEKIKPSAVSAFDGHNSLGINMSQSIESFYKSLQRTSEKHGDSKAEQKDSQIKPSFNK